MQLEILIPDSHEEGRDLQYPRSPRSDLDVWAQKLLHPDAPLRHILILPTSEEARTDWRLLRRSQASQPGTTEAASGVSAERLRPDSLPKWYTEPILSLSCLVGGPRRIHLLLPPF